MVFIGTVHVMGLSKLQWTFRFFRILVFLDFQDNGCLLQDLDFKGFSG